MQRNVVSPARYKRLRVKFRCAFTSLNACGPVTKSASTCTDDALFRAVVEHPDGTKLQVDVFGLDLTALIDTRQVVE